MLSPTLTDYQNIPPEMRNPRLRQWVIFQCVPQPDGKIKKIPRCPNGSFAVGSDGTKVWDKEKQQNIVKKQWFLFNECITAIQYCVGNAVGFALTEEYRLLFIDFDHCIDEIGRVSARTMAYLKALEPAEPYIERSISGRGIHAYVWYTGKKLPCNPETGVELYTADRFVVMTGVPL